MIRWWILAELNIIYELLGKFPLQSTTSIARWAVYLSLGKSTSLTYIDFDIYIYPNTVPDNTAKRIRA